MKHRHTRFKTVGYGLRCCTLLWSGKSPRKSARLEAHALGGERISVINETNKLRSWKEANCVEVKAVFHIYDAFFDLVFLKTDRKCSSIYHANWIGRHPQYDQVSTVSHEKKGTDELTILDCGASEPGLNSIFFFGSLVQGESEVIAVIGCWASCINKFHVT